MYLAWFPTGRIMATSRTYNLLGEGNELGLPVGATFGQFIATVSTDEAIRFGEQAGTASISLDFNGPCPTALTLRLCCSLGHRAPAADASGERRRSMEASPQRLTRTAR